MLPSTVPPLPWRKVRNSWNLWTQWVTMKWPQCLPNSRQQWGIVLKVSSSIHPSDFLSVTRWTVSLMILISRTRSICHLYFLLSLLLFLLLFLSLFRLLSLCYSTRYYRWVSCDKWRLFTSHIIIWRLVVISYHLIALYITGPYIALIPSSSLISSSSLFSPLIFSSLLLISFPPCQ